MFEKIAPALLASVITGAISSVGTVGAMQVHIDYLRENIVRHEKEMSEIDTRLREVEIK